MNEIKTISFLFVLGLFVGLILGAGGTFLYYSKGIDIYRKQIEEFAKTNSELENVIAEKEQIESKLRNSITTSQKRIGELQETIRKIREFESKDKESVNGLEENTKGITDIIKTIRERTTQK